MNKPDWDRVEEALSGVFGSAEVLVDGRRVRFERRLISKNRLGIMTYIDGLFLGAWLNRETEHTESRYLRLRSKPLLTPKDKEWYRKVDRLLRRKLTTNMDAKFVWLTPVWPSVASIRRHYEKTFTTIKLISTNGEPCA